eukprot:m.255494 g.255494  ORF g.255494 m.255494 type:complete len:941 (-) comp19617_c0_seq1:694-3516(-)
MSPFFGGDSRTRKPFTSIQSPEISRNIEFAAAMSNRKPRTPKQGMLKFRTSHEENVSRTEYFCDQHQATAQQVALANFNRVGYVRQTGQRKNAEKLFCAHASKVMCSAQAQIWEVFSSKSKMGRATAEVEHRRLLEETGVTLKWGSIEQLAETKSVFATRYFDQHSDQCQQYQTEHPFDVTKAHNCKSLFAVLLANNAAGPIAESGLNTLRRTLEHHGVDTKNVSEGKLKRCMQMLRDYMSTDSMAAAPGNLPETPNRRRGRKCSLNKLGASYLPSFVREMQQFPDVSIDVTMATDTDFKSCAYIPGHMRRLVTSLIQSESLIPEISFAYGRHYEISPKFQGCYIASVTIPGNSEHCFAVMPVTENENTAGIDRFVDFIAREIPGLDVAAVTMYFNDNYTESLQRAFPNAQLVNDWHQLKKNLTAARFPQGVIKKVYAMLRLSTQDEFAAARRNLPPEVEAFLQRMQEHPGDGALANRMYPTMYGRMCSHAESINEQHKVLRRLPLVAFLNAYTSTSFEYLRQQWQEASSAVNDWDPIGVYADKVSQATDAVKHLREPMEVRKEGTKTFFSVDVRAGSTGTTAEVFVEWDDADDASLLRSPRFVDWETLSSKCDGCRYPLQTRGVPCAHLQQIVALMKHGQPVPCWWQKQALMGLLPETGPSMDAVPRSRLRENIDAADVAVNDLPARVGREETHPKRVKHRHMAKSQPSPQSDATAKCGKDEHSTSDSSAEMYTSEDDGDSSDSGDDSTDSVLPRQVTATRTKDQTPGGDPMDTTAQSATKGVSTDKPVQSPITDASTHAAAQSATKEASTDTAARMVHASQNRCRSKRERQFRSVMESPCVAKQQSSTSGSRETHRVASASASGHPNPVDQPSDTVLEESRLSRQKRRAERVREYVEAKLMKHQRLMQQTTSRKRKAKEGCATPVAKGKFEKTHSHAS